METITLKPPRTKKVRPSNGSRQQRQKTTHHAGFWLFPWGYPQTIAITGMLIFIGFLLEMMAGSKGATMPSWPINLYLLVGFMGLLVALSIFSKKNSVIAWLSNIPSAICFIAALGLLSLIAGIIPQDLEVGSDFIRKLGLNHIVSSWPFAFAILLLLTNLGIATLRKLYPWQWQNLRFIFNHLGLWIIIAGSTFGSSDLQRLIMFTNEGQSTNLAHYDENTTIEMPFSIYLNDFKMEQYAPKLTLIDSRTGEILLKRGEPILEAQRGAKSEFYGWQIEVLQFFSFAAKTEDGFEPSETEGAAPAVLVKAANSRTKAVTMGWISSGSHAVEPVGLSLGHALLAMTIPQPKKFQSDVILTTKDGMKHNAVLEVNKPVNISGWKLYQISYDEKLGSWSKLSVIEAVRDPWLPVVYFGIFLLLTGTLYMLWMGAKVKGVNQS